MNARFKNIPIGWTLFFAGIVLLYLLSLRAYFVGFFNDDAFYVIGARSLAQGKYVELNHPLEPKLVNYMPGYPMLLTPFARIFSGTKIFQILTVAFTVGSVWLFFNLIRRKDQKEIWIPALLLFALNPLIMSHSGTVLSDIPFLFFLLLFWFLVDRKWERVEPVVWWGLGALAAFCFYLRPVGALAGGVAALFLLKEKRWKETLFFLSTFVALIVPWFAWTKMSRGYWMWYGIEYAGQYQNSPISSYVQSMQWGFPYYVKQFFNQNLWRPVFVWQGKIVSLLNVVFGIFFAWGFVRLARSSSRLVKMALTFLVVYLLVHLGWHRQSGRYLIAVLPFLYFIFFTGCAQVGAFVFKKPKAFAWTIAIICLITLTYPMKKILHASLFGHTPVNTPTVETFDWIKKNTAPTDVFVCEFDGIFYLHTNRKAWHFPKGLQTNQLIDWILQSDIQWVYLADTSMFMKTRSGTTVHDPISEHEFQSALESSPKFELGYQNQAEKTALFKVKTNHP